MKVGYTLQHHCLKGGLVGNKGICHYIGVGVLHSLLSSSKFGSGRNHQEASMGPFTGLFFNIFRAEGSSDPRTVPQVRCAYMGVGFLGFRGLGFKGFKGLRAYKG